jgi:hypothetical protein
MSALKVGDLQAFLDTGIGAKIGGMYVDYQGLSWFRALSAMSPWTARQAEMGLTTSVPALPVVGRA